MSLQGIYQASSKGFGFFTPEGAEGRESDLFVPPRCDGGAWNGDKVSAVIRPDPTPSRWWDAPPPSAPATRSPCP